MSVTIVLPMAGGLRHHRATATSIRDHVDFTRHQVYVINDGGPDADAIEEFVHAHFKGEPNFRYLRNDVPLGFAGSCGRAIAADESGSDSFLFLGNVILAMGVVDELVAVLGLYEKHGVVFPRAADASIASVPLLPSASLAARSDAGEMHHRLQAHLPRYSVTPFAVGPCLLVRRRLVEDYGLGANFNLDGGQAEFSLEVNRYGYSAVMANAAYVEQLPRGTRDQGQPEGELDSNTLQRFPFASKAVADYLRYLVDPIDWFADRLFGDSRAKVLIDLNQLDPLYNGSSRYALSFLSSLAQRRDEVDAEITITSSAETVAAFDLSSYGFRVVADLADDEIFDLGFALAPITDPQQLQSLNRRCVRWVISCLDVISLRVVELLEVDFTRRQVVLDGLRFADRVITISESTLDDVEALFGDQLDRLRSRARAVHLGLPESELAALPSTPKLLDAAEHLVANGGYVLVVGNDYPHKRLAETVNALDGFSAPLIVFGPRNAGGLEGPRRVVIPGGQVSDELLDRVYRNALCVVYPSSYEGFGLPIVESISRSVPVVLSDSPISHEVVDSLKLRSLAHFFGPIRDLPSVVDEAIAAPRIVPPRQIRTLADYNHDVILEIVAELARPVDIAALRERVRHFQHVDAYSDNTERALNAALASRTVRMARFISQRLAPLRRGAARLRRQR